MIPIRLTIEGLYSYQERQTIDFTSLIEAGLFGIFGAVGSGKSSILEAITFVLYGETERLNLRDKRYYNMMNLKSNRSYIEFDFINFEKRVFRATREFKRHSKNFDDVKTSAVQFYEYKEEIWIPVADTTARAIIGLSYDNFKRTIIIPQGQFKEFIELGATERTKMMKEIFNLQKYDLQDKASKLISETNSRLEQLTGKLSGFEDVSIEAILEIEEKLALEKKNQELVQEKLNRVTEEFQQLKALKEEAELLEKNLATFETLEDNKQLMDIKQREIDEYDRVFRIFSPWVTEKNIIEKEIAKKSTEYDRQLEEANQIRVIMQELESKVNVLKPEFETIEHQKRQIQDLETIIRLKDLEDHIQQAQSRTAKGKAKVDEYEERAKNTEKELNVIFDTLERLKERRTDAELLVAVSTWYQVYESLTSSLARLQISIDKNQNEIILLDSDLHKIDVNDEKTNVLAEQIKQAEKVAEQLEVENRLAQYTHTLHDGEPCPLCGALEHPQVLSGKDVSNEILAVRERLSLLNQQKDEWVQQKAKVHHMLQTKTRYQDQLTELQAEKDTINRHTQQHIEKFIWKEFDPNDRAPFIAKTKEAKDVDLQITKLEEVTKIKRLELDETRRDLEKFNKALKQIEAEEIENTTAFKTSIAHLTTLEYRSFSSAPKDNIQTRHMQLKHKIEETEYAYKETEKELHTQNMHFASLEATLILTKKIIDDYHIKLQHIDAQIVQNIDQNGFKHFGEIEAILHKDINAQQIRVEIEQFNITYKTLKNQIEAQQRKLQHTPFEQDTFDQKNLALESIREEWDIVNNSVTRHSIEITRLQQAYASKKELLEQQNSLQKRATNLKIIFNLLKGNGFVQYVSAIYLRQLCDQANIRFHRMTRNQLSLSLNENNDFEIIDYLNDGKSRSVKTLSGGQAFQVSLSLALALAESVQSNAMADKNFFFIDEGFGTQDAESVNIVFETLLSLQKENRIVGIISHVDELKERIPLSITVRKDEEKGSFI